MLCLQTFLADILFRTEIVYQDTLGFHSFDE